MNTLSSGLTYAWKFMGAAATNQRELVIVAAEPVAGKLRMKRRIDIGPAA
jgi:hypothetical protein